jgi:hypothetical protein
MEESLLGDLPSAPAATNMSRLPVVAEAAAPEEVGLFRLIRRVAQHATLP